MRRRRSGKQTICRYVVLAGVCVVGLLMSVGYVRHGYRDAYTGRTQLHIVTFPRWYPAWQYCWRTQEGHDDAPDWFYADHARLGWTIRMLPSFTWCAVIACCVMALYRVLATDRGMYAVRMVGVGIVCQTVHTCLFIIQMQYAPGHRVLYGAIIALLLMCVGGRVMVPASGKPWIVYVCVPVSVAACVISAEWYDWLNTTFNIFHVSFSTDWRTGIVLCVMLVLLHAVWDAAVWAKRADK